MRRGFITGGILAGGLAVAAGIAALQKPDPISIMEKTDPTGGPAMVRRSQDTLSLAYPYGKGGEVIFLRDNDGDGEPEDVCVTQGRSAYCLPGPGSAAWEHAESIFGHYGPSIRASALPGSAPYLLGKQAAVPLNPPLLSEEF